MEPLPCSNDIAPVLPIRIADLEIDAAAILELQASVLPFEHKGLNPILWAGMQTWLLQIEDVLIGSVSIYLPGGILKVNGLMIRDEYRRKGYGELLVRKVLNYYLEWNPSLEFYLRVLPDNEAAIALYKKIGFGFTGVEEYGELEMYFPYSSRPNNTIIQRLWNKIRGKKKI